MLAVVLLLAATAPPPPPPPRVTALASVRILSAARVSLGRSATGAPYRLSTATVRTEDGQRRPAQLVEFE